MQHFCYYLGGMRVRLGTVFGGFGYVMGGLRCKRRDNSSLYKCIQRN